MKKRHELRERLEHVLAEDHALSSWRTQVREPHERLKSLAVAPQPSAHGRELGGRLGFARGLGDPEQLLRAIALRPRTTRRSFGHLP